MLGSKSVQRSSFQHDLNYLSIRARPRRGARLGLGLAAVSGYVLECFLESPPAVLLLLAT